MNPVDLVIVIVYLAAMPVIGVLVGRRQKSANDYFVGERSMPWWAVTLSVVATETSTLTVISTPGLVFGSAFLFLEVAFGYIIGRVIAAFVLLPRYFRGNYVSAYEFLGRRFGRGLQGTASVTFVVTRLLAEGLRLFAGAIPIKAILSHYGIHTEYWHIVVLLTALTVIYAFVGGIKSVIWVDVIQWSLYILGAIGAVIFLSTKLPSGWTQIASSQGRFQLTDFASNLLTNPYAFLCAVVGGAFLSMASHGADQLIVGRLLSCRNLRDGQRALIGSSIVVFVQFALFLLVGAMLWVYTGGKTGTTATAVAAGKMSGDDVFSNFIVNDLPVGLAGLLIAGILASTMGALASALNALSTSTIADLYQRFTHKSVEDAKLLRHGRMWTLIWAAVFAVFASMFTNSKDPVIQQGLGIVGYTYGALLGSFFLGLLVRKARQSDAVIAFGCSVVGMAFLILFVKFDKATTEVHIQFGAATKTLVPLATYWYTFAGVLITLIVGGLLSLRRRGADPNVAKLEEAAEGVA
ncbi:sodium:solute symporter [Amycolatopsis rubida]|uniref:Sodium:solute symporter n=1 Tax=Amycolatopsis rubida TaxID=112413 RepID=A0A1I6BBU7_9PSEU|nr:sodium:solute symporter [Amycolatopsis rubida]MYW95688.1 sodium:solute symporter [Amycolatopsis rubida]NEC60677.1 sodium:solute symporter [Amycolatopsis rubida]SFQ78418.1 transporter, SSS family [Amycolatopsis rubida]